MSTTRSDSCAVQVVVRVRPNDTACVGAIDRLGTDEVFLSSPRAATTPTTTPRDGLSGIESRGYRFDSVLGPSATQAAVWSTCGLKMVEHVLDGYNVAMLAYGQTGGGKTHTMLGDCEWGSASFTPSSTTPRTPRARRETRPNRYRRSNLPSPDVCVRTPGSTSRSADELSPSADAVLSKDAGLTPRVFAHLFQRVRDLSAVDDQRTSFKITATFYEIYNEVVTDLLSGVSGLPVRGQGRVEGVQACEVCSLADVMTLLGRGLARRAVAETRMNTTSSRSHCILTCVVERRFEGRVTRSSVMNLVDLAGSERQRNAGNSSAARLKEASAINKSLTTLGHVVRKLVAGASHIPYRDSKLTHILQESLGGNAKAVLIAAVSPAKKDAAETESTLSFASRARHLRNRPVVNDAAADDPGPLMQDNAHLQKELNDAALVATMSARDTKRHLLCVQQDKETAGVILSTCECADVDATPGSMERKYCDEDSVGNEISAAEECVKPAGAGRLAVVRSNGGESLELVPVQPRKQRPVMRAAVMLASSALLVAGLIGRATFKKSGHRMGRPADGPKVARSVIYSRAQSAEDGWRDATGQFEYGGSWV